MVAAQLPFRNGFECEQRAQELGRGEWTNEEYEYLYHAEVRVLSPEQRCALMNRFWWPVFILVVRGMAMPEQAAKSTNQQRDLKMARNSFPAGALSRSVVGDRHVCQERCA